MTPEAFAEEHGLSLDEALMILSAREARKQMMESAERWADTRLTQALLTLSAAQKKVGVQAVAVGAEGIKKTFDQETAENLDRFYEKAKHQADVGACVQYDEFDQSGGD